MKTSIPSHAGARRAGRPAHRRPPRPAGGRHAARRRGLPLRVLQHPAPPAAALASRGRRRPRARGRPVPRRRPPGAGTAPVPTARSSSTCAAFVADRGDTVRFVAPAAGRHGVPAGVHRLLRAARVGDGLPARASTGTPCRCGSGQAGTDAVVEAHPMRVHALRRLPLLHAGRRRRATGCSPPARRSRSWSSRAACTRRWTCHKWAGKLGPAVPGELALDCFELARDIRVLDMRASPYDLRAYGHAAGRRSRRPRARPSTCAASAGSPSGRPSCGSGCSRSATSAGHVRRLTQLHGRTVRVRSEVTSTRTGRWVRLDGTTNTRDLGGLPTTDGGHARCRAGSCAATTCRPSVPTTSRGWSTRSACAR